MSLELEPRWLHAIHRHGEQAYPEEGAGLLLGTVSGDGKRVAAILELPNTREDGARRNRYLLTPQDYLQGETEAARLGLEVIGVFHSHPDHPNQPSEFDREWAMPWFSYLITSVAAGRALASRSWRLLEDRSAFVEEPVLIGEPAAPPG
jgi:proteasome lid subunit RPN8/RPN11